MENVVVGVELCVVLMAALSADLSNDATTHAATDITRLDNGDED
jgi:hypothetical protein